MKTQNSLIKSIIRVNQAGEYGAVQIYKGQQAILKKTPLSQTLHEMQTHEEEHLEMFNKLIVQHHVRPTALSPLWRIGGFTLGAVTALLGKKAAMACTIAVEEVIEEHYESQKETLAHEDSVALAPLKQAISKCQADEIAHKNLAMEHNNAESHEPTTVLQAAGFFAMSHTIKTISKAAIWLSKRF